MKKSVIVGASSYNRKAYVNPEYSDLPEEVCKELKMICIEVAEKIRGVYMIGFYQDGSVYCESQGAENDFQFDDIGAKLETDKLRVEKKELFGALELWYKAFKTEEGQKLVKERLS